MIRRVGTSKAVFNFTGLHLIPCYRANMSPAVFLYSYNSKQWVVKSFIYKFHQSVELLIN